MSKLTSLVALTLSSVVLALSFQNCGDSFEVEEQLSLSSQGSLELPSVDEPGLLRRPASPVWQLEAWNNRPLTHVYFDYAEGDDEGSLTLNLEEEREPDTHLKVEASNFSVFLNEAPRRTAIGSASTEYIVLFLAAEGDSVLAVRAHAEVLEVLWIADLAQKINSEQFEAMRLVKDGDTNNLVIGQNYISKILSANPLVELIAVCSETQHPERNVCVANSRSCAISDGTGTQAWSGTAWGSCTISTCKTGFIKSGNTCVAVPTCTTTQHLQNNVCVANKRSCAISNGAGIQAWTGTAWGSCTVSTCKTGFVKSGNTCVAVPNCTTAQHLQNNICVANTRSCAISNGTGTQAWTGTAWGSCMVATCKTGFIKSGNTCVAVPNCTTAQHLQSNVCVANTRSCAVSNGTGTQAWTGTAWGSCTVSTCKIHHYKSGGSCVAAYLWSNYLHPLPRDPSKMARIMVAFDAGGSNPPEFVASKFCIWTLGPTAKVVDFKTAYTGELVYFYMYFHEKEQFATQSYNGYPLKVTGTFIHTISCRK